MTKYRSRFGAAGLGVACVAILSIELRKVEQRVSMSSSEDHQKDAREWADHEDEKTTLMTRAVRSKMT